MLLSLSSSGVTIARLSRPGTLYFSDLLTSNQPGTAWLQRNMGVCASKPAEKGESEAYPNIALAPGVTADIRPGLESAKTSDQDSIQDNSEGLPIAKDSYGAEEVQKPRSARVSLDAHRDGTASAEGALLQEGRLPGDNYGGSASDLDDPELLKEYTRLAEMLRYSPYPVGLIAIEEDNQPYVFVNNVSFGPTHSDGRYAAQCFEIMHAHEAKCEHQQFHLQVFCERLGFIDTDVVGKSW